MKRLFALSILFLLATAAGAAGEIVLENRADLKIAPLLGEKYYYYLHGSAYWEDHVYLAFGRWNEKEGHSGLMVILDVARVEAPRLVKSVTLPAHARRIWVAGGYTYLITDEDLKIFFLDGPARPRLVGSLPGSFRDVYVFGKRLYLLGGSFKGDKETGWLEIYDVRDPARLVRLGRVEFADYPYMVRADAKAAYIAAGSGGLIVVDCTKPERPVILSRVKKRDEWVCGLNVQGHVVYLAIAKVVPGGAYNGILRVMDVSDLRKPKIYSSAVIIEYNASSEIWDIGYNKQYVYLGSGMGLYVIDISNPYAPNIIGVNEMPSSFSGLLIFNEYIMTPYIEIYEKIDFSYGIESCSRLLLLRKINKRSDNYE